MLKTELPGKMKPGIRKRMFMDAVREGMAVVEVTEEDAEYRTKWRWIIRCGDLRRGSRKKKKVRFCNYKKFND